MKSLRENASSKPMRRWPLWTSEVLSEIEGPSRQFWIYNGHNAIIYQRTNMAKVEGDRVQVNVIMPLSLRKELDHERAETREGISAITVRMLRNSLEHIEEILAGCEPRRKQKK